MTSHDNVHIPKESWPKFSWFLIEFALVIVVALVIAWQTSPLFEDYVYSYGWECEQESQETNCSVAEEKTMDQTMLNWIFWSIVGAVVIGWYLLIRNFVFKKPIL